jgi:hypothetical protein
MGGWEQVEDESAEAGGAGGGSTAVVEDKESKEVDSAPAATAQEGQEENQDFENTIHDWIADYRKDSSQDMKMQIRMYALQVDIHQRSKAARLILKDILHKEETMLNIETQTGKEGKLLVFGVKVVLGWKCMYSHRCSVLFVHCSLFFVLCSLYLCFFSETNDRCFVAFVAICVEKFCSRLQPCRLRVPGRH